MKKILSFILLAMVALGAWGLTDYASLQVKAGRFFRQQEWASAAAMYDLMLERRPDEAAVYGRAIVVAAVRGDTATQMTLMKQAMTNRVPFDSVFAAVREVSFDLGRTNLYERFLLMTRDDQPWLARTIDSYLMQYYTFRRDPAMMIKYSKIMLAGMPDNVGFLTTLAQGEMQSGDTDGAMSTYRRILAIAPDNYNALLELGNYGYMRRSDATPQQLAETLDLLRRAMSLKPTPYVQAMIHELEGKTAKK